MFLNSLTLLLILSQQIFAKDKISCVILPGLPGLEKKPLDLAYKVPFVGEGLVTNPQNSYCVPFYIESDGSMKPIVIGSKETNDLKVPLVPLHLALPNPSFLKRYLILLGTFATNVLVTNLAILKIKNDTLKEGFPEHISLATLTNLGRNLSLLGLPLSFFSSQILSGDLLGNPLTTINYLIQIALTPIDFMTQKKGGMLDGQQHLLVILLRNGSYLLPFFDYSISRPRNSFYWGSREVTLSKTAFYKPEKGGDVLDLDCSLAKMSEYVNPEVTFLDFMNLTDSTISLEELSKLMEKYLEKHPRYQLDISGLEVDDGSGSESQSDQVN